MATDLFTPILNDRTRSVRFFNGRLLSGEAMTDEQSGLRMARELLAQAVGDGVVQGLEVKEAVGASTIQAPILSVGTGVAINRRGEVLLLAADTQVALVRPAHQAQAPASVFQRCTPPQQGVYLADSGVYLLTVSSIGATSGLAQVSGLGGHQASCNAKYVVDAVQFRLLELPVDRAILSDPRLRNLVAYQCFGVDHLLDFARDPFGTAGEPRTLLDDIRDTRQLTDCDVPLALMYWTATGGIQFLDLWSVRRRVTRTRSASQFSPFDDERLALSEAMVLQFQEEIAARALATNPTATVATEVFRYLPPVGALPLKSRLLERGFDYHHFFQHRTYREPIFLNAAKLWPIAERFLLTAPIDLQQSEMMWLYRVMQNARLRNDRGDAGPQQYLLFASGQIPYQGYAQFDVSYYNYSNYS